MAEFFDNAYDFVFTANDVIGQARQFYENLKAAGEQVGSFYNWFNSANNKMFKTGNLRGSNVYSNPISDYNKRNQFRAITQLPQTAAFKQYMFKGPSKREFHKIKIPRAIRLMYKPLTLLGYREMIITAANGEAAGAYFNILPAKELVTMRATALEHIGKQIEIKGAATGVTAWTACIHQDTHKYVIANACNQPVVVDCYVFVYRDDDSNTLQNWIDWDEYEKGDGIFSGQFAVTSHDILITKENPRFNPMTHRRSIPQNYRLIDKKRLALGPGQNTTYTYSQSGDLIISNAHLDEQVELTYSAYDAYYPTSATYGNSFLRGITKVVYFRTYCTLLAEDNGTAATTGDDVGIGKAKILIREELTRKMGAYPITRAHTAFPGSGITLDNVTEDANAGGASVKRSGLEIYDFYSNYKKIAGTAQFVNVENDDVKNGTTTT